MNYYIIIVPFKLNVIWCFENIDEDINKFNNTISRLSEFTNNTFLFPSTTEVEYFLSNLLHDEKVIIIISGTYAKELKYTIKNNNNIFSVFVYCFNTDIHKEWIKEYSKIEFITNNYKLLEKVLFNSLKNTYCNKLKLKSEKSNNQ